MHMMGAPPVSARAARSLPHPDIVSPPAGNVIVGLDTEDAALLPRLFPRGGQQQRVQQGPGAGAGPQFARSVALDGDQRAHGGLVAAVASRVHMGLEALSASPSDDPRRPA